MWLNKIEFFDVLDLCSTAKRKLSQVYHPLKPGSWTIEADLKSLYCDDCRSINVLGRDKRTAPALTRLGNYGGWG